MPTAVAGTLPRGRQSHAVAGMHRTLTPDRANDGQRWAPFVRPMPPHDRWVTDLAERESMTKSGCPESPGRGGTAVEDLDLHSDAASQRSGRNAPCATAQLVTELLPSIQARL